MTFGTGSVLIDGASAELISIWAVFQLNRCTSGLNPRTESKYFGVLFNEPTRPVVNQLLLHCAYRPYLVRVNTPFVQVPGLKVEIDNVMYVPAIEAPVDKPYPFVYFLNIQNNSNEVVTIKARKWVVREASGETVVVEGPGVVGENPRLEPGENFAYNSCHVVKWDAEAKGSLFGVTESGVLFSLQIPPFSLNVPTAG